MQVGRRFRLYPTDRQAAELRRWIGGQRFVFNAKIEEFRYQAWLRRHAILSPSWRDPNPAKASLFDQKYSHFRATNPWMGEVPAEVFRNGAYRYRRAVAATSTGAGAPAIKHRSGPQSVMLTSELFSIQDGCLRIASRKQDLGFVAWKAHRAFLAPRMIVITVEPDGRWYGGFNYEDGSEVPELAALPQSQDEVLGVDLGIIQVVTTSEGEVHHPSPAALRSHQSSENRARQLQRKLARQHRGSRRREATKRRIARLRSRQSNVRRDFAHKTSHALCQGAHKAIAFENLRLKNMTAAPAPRPNSETGGYDANGAAAKSGLNASLLHRALGLIRLLTAYKAERAGKHFVHVPAAYSSQECSHCHHTSPLNRPSQAEFICQACGTTLNADHNGATIIAQRGHHLLSAGNRQTAPVEQPRVASKREASCASRG